MIKPSLIAILVVLATLAALTACSDPSPTPETAVTSTLEAVAATSPPPANAADPKAADPTATAAPTETTAPTSTTEPSPIISPPPEPTATPKTDGKLAPLGVQDLRASPSGLSETELNCIGNLPETLDRVLAWPGPGPRDELLRLIGCLSDETLARLFLVGLITGPEPLSLETSDCVRAVFAVIDPQEVMTAGIEDDPQKAERATASSAAVATTVTACLTDEEWERATPGIETGPQERAEKRCLMEALGGAGEMAEAMRAAWEGDFEGLTEAEEACELDREPAPNQGTAAVPRTLDKYQGMDFNGFAYLISASTAIPAKRATGNISPVARAQVEPLSGSAARFRLTSQTAEAAPPRVAKL